MTYYVIYDGHCNLCVTFVQLLETLDQGQKFHYISMQDQQALSPFGITAADCEKGVILLDANHPEQRWQGTDAAEEIGRMLPAGDLVVSTYRALPGLKWAGDRIYEQVRDNRYALFGKRDHPYKPLYPACPSDNCRL